MGKEITGRTPWIVNSYYTQAEMEFFVCSLLDYKNYGIEVKSEDGAGHTVREVLKDGKIQYLYFLGGNTQGGVAEDGKVMTMLLYLVGRVGFGNDLK